MKKSASTIIAVLCMCLPMAVLFSCLSDDTTETSPSCAITGFSIGNIKSAVVITNLSGNDTTVYRTISGTTVRFSIDQLKGLITSVDSLPTWTDITRIVPSVTHTGTLYRKSPADQEYYPVTSSKDSIDFTNSVDYLVVATDGQSSKHYTVTIRKSKADADSLLWSETAGHNLDLGNGKARIMTLGNRLYAFTRVQLPLSVTTSDDGTIWTTPVKAKTSATELDIDQLTIWHDQFYTCTPEGKIYTSADAANWQLAAEPTVDRLLAADANYLYALQGNSIVATTDLQNWTTAGTTDIARLPQSPVATVAYTTSTNTDLQSVVMAGKPQDTTIGYTAVWYKISSATATSDQPWSYIDHTVNNSYPLPEADHISLVRYDNTLYAVGTGFTTFYRSVDNGITWKAVTEKFMLPRQHTSTQTPHIAVIGNDMWLISTTSDGITHVWKGRLNKFNA